MIHQPWSIRAPYLPFPIVVTAVSRSKRGGSADMASLIERRPRCVKKSSVPELVVRLLGRLFLRFTLVAALRGVGAVLCRFGKGWRCGLHLRRGDRDDGGDRRARRLSDHRSGRNR